MRDENKWDFTKPDPQEDPPEVKERKGMTFLLIAGIVFFVGGLWGSWKIGALNPKTFLGIDCSYSTLSYSRSYSDHRFVLMMFNSPWLLGGAMIGASLNYFFRKRKK